MNELWSIIGDDTDSWYDIFTNRQGDGDYRSVVYWHQPDGERLQSSVVIEQSYLSQKAAIKGHEALFNKYKEL